MNRFFVNASQINEVNKTISILGEDVKHISKVLRLSIGDLIELCDEAFEYICEIKDISKNEVTLSYDERVQIKTEASIRVTLYQGIPKSTKMDLIIQKTTEMGIAEVVPVFTQRTVVQLDSSKDKIKKTDRWQKISAEAAKQSKRGVIPLVHPPMLFKEALKHCQGNDLNIIAYEGEEKNSLKPLLQGVNKSLTKIGIWIGPEGGYTENEVVEAIQHQINTVTLGPRILRTETAGFALLSIVMYELGDLGGSM
ncbi:16S rRNA (uracil(1498)-N(3))-methyltransferase [Alkaliphilus pronyensis]|uniref:Ribosomal RNA small subunit methyltransferase E n=1 Tax=Alkaliphilus pronyensis TaxID=1482732 RepID=A0A6I0FFM9_9FIRM|nr:RsmE family RNA methyltransferase [Alkaliphilus pronyensis]KAB3539102.1 16S rRNA (uracil(1498)-N(3))-methyltransferase [Alkaliphilus pronyensis]